MGAYFFYRKLLLTVACMLPGILAFSQKTGDYRSVKDGNWNDLSTWEIYTDSGWVTPALENGVPDTSASNIQISANNIVTITSSVIADQIRIEAKAILVVADSATFEIANGVGTDLIVEGAFEAVGHLIANGTIGLLAHSIYRHKNKSGISTATLAWHPLAKIEISSGGSIDWVLTSQQNVLCHLSVLENTNLNFITDKNVEVITTRQTIDTGLYVASGSTLNLPASNKFKVGRNSAVIVNGIVRNAGTIDLIEENAVISIKGKLINAGQFLNTNAMNLLINDDAVYEHAQDGGVLPPAKWGAKSNCFFRDTKTKLPEGLNQVLGNVSFNSDFATDIILNQTLDCLGNLTIDNSSQRALVINTDSIHHSVLVGGDFLFKAGHVVLVNSNGTASLQVTKNFIQTGGNLVLKGSSGDAQIYTMGDLIRDNGTLFFNLKDSVSGDGDAEVVVVKNFVQKGGTTNFSQNHGIGNLYVDRGFSFLGGVITETGSGLGNIYFSGDSVQVFDAIDRFQNIIDVYVDSLSILQMATENTRISSSGKFVLRRGGTIALKHPSGLVAAPTLTGHIFTSERIYEDLANVIFDGKSPQVTGTAFETFIPATVTINNPTTTSQLTKMKIAGDLYINAGEFYSRNNDIYIYGNWINNGYYNFGNYSDITFNGTEPQIITGINPTSFYGLTIDNNNGVTLVKDISVAAQLSLINGNLNVGASVLTMGPRAKAVASDSFSSSRMIVLEETGVVRKDGNNFSSASYFFPIGNFADSIAYYTPINIIFSKSGTFNGYTSVSLTHKKHPASPDDQNYLARFWTVKQEGYSKFYATVSTTFDPADVTGSIEALRMGKFSHDDTTLSSGWVSFPDPANSNTFTTTQITSFSDFTGIGLSSAEGKDSSKSMARVARIENSNRYSASEIKLFPNPVSNGPLQLWLYNFPDAQYEIVITNTQGQKILQHKHRNTSGQNYLKIEFDSKLPGGVYYLTVTGSEKSWFSTFIKQ